MSVSNLTRREVFWTLVAFAFLFFMNYVVSPKLEEQRRVETRKLLEERYGPDAFKNFSEGK
jgi:hypothetical protein